MKPTTVFVRRSSGLVRAVGVGDAWIYNMMTMSWSAAVAYGLFMTSSFFPGGNFPLAVLLMAILGTSTWTTYVLISTTVPRSGVDWVAQSRFLSPWVAFPVVIGDFFYLVYGTVYGTWIMTYLTVQPTFALLGNSLGSAALSGLASWSVSAAGYFTIGLIFLLVMGWQMAFPIGLFAKIQRVLMVLSAIVVGIFIVGFLATSHSAFVSNFNNIASKFVADPDYYDTVLQTAANIGFDANQGFNWYDQIGLMCFLWPTIGFAMYSAQLAGEIKSADKIRTENIIINGSGWTLAIVWIVILLVTENTIGLPFIKSAGTLYLVGQWALPVGPIGALYLACLDPLFGTLGVVLLSIFFLGMLCSVYQIFFNTIAGPLRMFFAMAFDRGLPDFFTKVHKKWRTPTYMVALAWVVGLFILWTNTYYPNVAPFWLPAALGSALIPFAVTSLAGALMPFTARALFEASPIARYKVGAVPLVTVLGCISVVFNAVLAYYWLTVPTLGVNPASMIYAIIFYVVGLAWFLIWRVYRKRQGIDFSMAFKVVPPD